MTDLFETTPKKQRPPLPSISLFTDGACKGNPGPGGWAYILRDEKSGEERVEYGYDPSTTNNRMELLAVIEGLQAIRKPAHITLVGDSEYVLKGITEWLPGWKARGWKTAAKKPVKNVDLWQQLDELLAIHQISVEWTRGHIGHPENERCDQLASDAASGKMGS